MSSPRIAPSIRFSATLIWASLPAGPADAGVLVTEPGGSVLITVARDEGAEAFEPKLYLRRTDRASSTTIPLGRQDEVHAKNLTPGVDAISGYFKGMVSVKGEVKVVAGQTSPVKLSLRAGAPLRCQVWWPGMLRGIPLLAVG